MGLHYADRRGVVAAHKEADRDHGRTLESRDPCGYRGGGPAGTAPVPWEIEVVTPIEGMTSPNRGGTSNRAVNVVVNNLK